MPALNPEQTQNARQLLGQLGKLIEALEETTERGLPFPRGQHATCAQVTEAWQLSSQRTTRPRLTPHSQLLDCCRCRFADLVTPKIFALQYAQKGQCVGVSV